MTVTAPMRTHWDGCYRSAGHHACALREIERLTAQLAAGVSSGKPSPLTKRQRDVLRFIRAFMVRYEMAPTLQEIAYKLDYKSLATVHEILTRLERKGHIRREFNQPRAITIIEAAP